MRYLIVSLFSLCTLAFVLFTSEGCNNPASPGSSFSLSVADVSCTEAWLSLHVNTTPANVTINKNGTALFNLQLTTRDTTIYDSTLSPNQTYTYQALLGSTKSNAATAKTMDTTSQNFTWQLYSFGDFLATGSTSMLYGVSIVNSDDIWATGEIYVIDSTGNPDLTYHNVIHWDSNKWDILRFLSNCRIYYPYCGGDTLLVSPGRGVFAFDSRNIWFTAGDIFYYNGEKSQLYGGTGPENGSATNIWGNNKDIWFAGNNGFISHFNTNWQKIASGTSLDLMDIYSADGKDIYVSGSNAIDYSGILLKGNTNGFKVLAQGKNINADQLFNPYFAGYANTVWASNKGTVYFGGNLLYRYKFGQYSLVRSLPGNYFGGNAAGQYWGLISKVRGNADNDIIMVGQGNTIRHFNGVTWQQLGMPYDYNSEYTWVSVDMKDNIIVAAGYTNSQAVIMVLKRQ